MFLLKLETPEGKTEIFYPPFRYLKLFVIDPRDQFVLQHRLLYPPLDNKPGRGLGDNPGTNKISDTQQSTVP